MRRLLPLLVFLLLVPAASAHKAGWVLCQNISNGQTLSGTYNWQATSCGSNGTKTTRIDFKVDGTLKGSDTSWPMTYSLNTNLLSNGSHAFSIVGTASDGHTYVNTVTADVQNAEPPPSGYPASFFTGPAGANNPLPPGGYPFTHSFFGETPPNDLAGTNGDGPLAFQQRETQIGHQMNIIHDWQQGRCSLDMTRLNSYRVQAITVLAWEPSQPYYDMVLNGSQDSCIQAVGAQLATITSGNPVILRMYHEWNGDWMAWSCKSGVSRPCGFSYPNHITPDQAKQMFQRTVDQLRIGGAFSNGKVATDLDWSEGYFANGDSFDETLAYPGDAYVDWISSTSYSQGVAQWCGPTTMHLCELAEDMTHGTCITPPLPEVQQPGFSCGPNKVPIGTEATYRGVKPYLLSETGLGHPAADSWAGSWMRYAGNYMSAHQPGLGAVTYFDFDPRSQGEAYNWRIDSSPSKLQGFIDWSNQARFAP